MLALNNACEGKCCPRPFTTRAWRSCNKRRRHFCLLPPARQQWGLGRSPHTVLGQAVHLPATLFQPGSRGRWGRKPPLPFCKQPACQEKRYDLTPQPTTALPGNLSGPGVWRKIARVSPVHPFTATPSHSNPLFPPQCCDEGLGENSRKKQFRLHQNYCSTFFPWPHQLFINSSKILLFLTSQPSRFSSLLKIPTTFF